MTNEEDEDLRGDYLSDVLDALIEGEEHVRLVCEGSPPDPDKLERLAHAMVPLRDGKLWYGWVRPTTDEVNAAFLLVSLAKKGAAPEVLVEPAREVYRSLADPGALYSLGRVLLWLAGEPCEEVPRPEHIRRVLDGAVAFFERGGDVRGFVPGAEDLARVRRLRELADAGDSEERRSLARQQWSRFPRDEVTDGIWRMTVKRGQGTQAL